MNLEQKNYYCVFRDPIFTVGNRNLPFDSTRFALAIRSVTHEIAGHAWPVLIDVAAAPQPRLRLRPYLTRPSAAKIVWYYQCLATMSKWEAAWLLDAWAGVLFTLCTLLETKDWIRNFLFIWVYLYNSSICNLVIRSTNKLENYQMRILDSIAWKNMKKFSAVLQVCICSIVYWSI